MRAEIFAGLIITPTIESFILNLLSQSRVRDLTSQLESLRHVAVENSEEINFVETREYDLLYSSEDLLSLLDFPWLFRPKVYLHRTTTWGCAVFDTRRGNWRWGVRFVKVKVKFAQPYRFLLGSLVHTQLTAVRAESRSLALNSSCLF
jgi:hypothetical protein